MIIVKYRPLNKKQKHKYDDGTNSNLVHRFLLLGRIGGLLQTSSLLKPEPNASLICYNLQTRVDTLHFIIQYEKTEHFHKSHSTGCWDDLPNGANRLFS